MLDPSRHPSSRPSAWRWVALVALVVYVPWNAQRALWFPDEPDVADPTMSMLATGDWLVPQRNAEPWLDYPPLTYWLGATSARLLGGPSPFALRLPIALMAVFFVVLVAWVVERRHGRMAGLWAGLSMATGPQFVYQAVNFHPDMAFALLIALGLGSYARGAHGSMDEETPPGAAGWMILGFGFFGGAILAKGPLGLLLPGLILVLWHGSQRQWRSLLRLAPLGVISVAVALPWYVAVANATEGAFVGREVYLQNFARFTAANRGHREPSWFYYLWRIGFDWGPWILFLPSALAEGFRRARDEPESRLAVLWFAASLIFFSAAETKRQVYLLPTYPAIAFLIGRHLATLCDAPARPWFRRTLSAIGWACAATGIGFALLVMVAPSFRELLPDPERTSTLLADVTFPFAFLGLGLSAGGIAIWRLARRGRTVGALTLLVAQGVFFYGMLLATVAPHMDRLKSYRTATLWLREQSGTRQLGYYFPRAQNKFTGFRVEDPLYLPLHFLHTPAQVAQYLTDETQLVILLKDQAENVAAGLDDWQALPSRDLVLGSTEFLVVGPRRPPSPP